MPVVDKYIIDVKTQGAKKSNSQMKNLSASSKQLGSSLIALGGAYFGTQGLISAIKGSVDAYAKQELAEKKLATALGKTSQALLNQASALQKVTMFGDEDIIMMQSMLGAFTKSEDEIKKLTVATLDLASGMGIDLKSAGDLVAKTVGSSTNALSRYGIQVEGAVGSSERLETLTGNIANLFGGQAKAQTETLAGSMAQLNNAVGDVAEAIGEKLAPSLTTTARFWADFLTEKEGSRDTFNAVKDDILNIADKMLMLNPVYLAGKVALDTYTKSQKESRLSHIEQADDLIKNNLLLTENRGRFLSLSGAIENYDKLLDKSHKSQDKIEQMALTRGVSYEVMEDTIRETLSTMIDTRRELTSGIQEESESINTTVESLQSYSELLGVLIEQTSSFGTEIRRSNVELEMQKVNTDNSIESQTHSISIFDQLNAVMFTQEKLTRQSIKAYMMMGARFGDTVNTAKAMGDALKDVSKRLITNAIQEITAHYIAKFLATTPLPPYISAPLAIAGATAFGAGVESLITGLEKHEQGGMVGGRRHSQGGTIIEAERGEFVMSRNAVNTIGVENLNRMNQGQSGGSGATIVINNPIVNSDFVENDFADLMREAVRKGADFGIS